jgi:hypothetical protein
MSNVIGDLVDKLDQSRERLLVAIEPLSDEALLAANALGKWSIADLLVNLTAWESELVTGLLHIDQGKKPARLLAALADAEAYSQKRFLENQGRDLDRIFDDLPQVRLQLEEWLEMFSEKQLTNKKQYAFFQGKALAEIIAQTTFQREWRYLPLVEAFARAMQALENEEFDNEPNNN